VQLQVKTSKSKTKTKSKGSSKREDDSAVHSLHVCPVFTGVVVTFKDGRVCCFHYKTGSGFAPRMPMIAASSAASGSVLWSDLLYDQKRGVVGARLFPRSAI
jgi:hypothetical protein